MIHNCIYIDLYKFHVLLLLCYCIEYNDWSTSVISLDQYQEKLQERRREWEASQPVQPVHHQNKRREIEQLRCTLQEREMELLEERREKEHIIARLQQQLQEKDRQITDKDQQLTEIQRGIQSREREYRERERQLQEAAREREQNHQQQLQQAQWQSQERERCLQQQLRERDQQERESSWVSVVTLSTISLSSNS